MPTEIEVELRPVPAQRIAALTRRAEGYGSASIGPVVGPLFPEVRARLDAAGVGAGPAVAVYAAEEAGGGVLVTAGFEVEDDVEAVPGLELHVLPESDAAVAVHRGAVDSIDASWAAVVRAMSAAGAVMAGASREIYLVPGDGPQSEWVTELVQPITRA